MAAREFRFIQCVIEALCDSIGIECPHMGATRRARINVAAEGLEDAAVTPSRIAGWYELPAYARRGIVIPGIEAGAGNPQEIMRAVDVIGPRN